MDKNAVEGIIGCLFKYWLNLHQFHALEQIALTSEVAEPLFGPLYLALTHQYII
jgi:hypothetical protein